MDSIYNLQIPQITVADSATARINYTHVLVFVCGFHKLYWITQTWLRIRQAGLVVGWFRAVNRSGTCLWNPKQQRRLKKSSNFSDSATDLVLTFCGVRLQYTESTVWPRNVRIETFRPMGVSRRVWVSEFLKYNEIFQNFSHVKKIRLETCI